MYNRLSFGGVLAVLAAACDSLIHQSSFVHSFSPPSTTTTCTNNLIIKPTTFGRRKHRTIRNTHNRRIIRDVNKYSTLTLYSFPHEDDGDVGGGGDDDGSVDHRGPSWKLSNDFNSFLNQCSIQSFIFLVNSLRDRHTALWVEEFTKPILHERTINKKDKKDVVDEKVLSNMAQALRESMPNQLEEEIKLLTYHGLGVINMTQFPTWDSYFDQLLEECPFTYVIETENALVPSYELEIDPISLCGRIISIRQQIANEFAKDLDVIAVMSETFLQSYYDKMKKLHDANIKDRNDSDSENDEDNKLDVDQANLLFLQFGVDPDNLQSSTDYKPSPLRSGNFDLLILLCTQEAIHRVLNGVAAGTTTSSIDKSSLQFLRNFYSNRIGTHFIGSNWYGRADDFMEELLSTLPSVVQLQDEQCGLVDPEGIARSILKMREQVASEWLDLALDSPQNHADIKRRQLNKLMGVDNNSLSGNSFQ